MRPLVLLLSVLAACAGTPSKPADSATAALTPGQQCVRDASAKRAGQPSEPERVTVKHVLVRYAGARNATPAITRSREDACLRAQEALDKLKSGASFAEVVASYSDEAGAATREGSLGAIERKDVAPSFADAAFELKMQEASPVVESPFGFHVILRVE